MKFILIKSLGIISMHLMGNRLRKAEFEIGDYATLVVSKGLIVIRKEENSEC